MKSITLKAKFRNGNDVIKDDIIQQIEAEQFSDMSEALEQLGYDKLLEIINHWKADEARSIWYQRMMMKYKGRK